MAAWLNCVPSASTDCNGGPTATVVTHAPIALLDVHGLGELLIYHFRGIYFDLFILNYWGGDNAST